MNGISYRNEETINEDIEKVTSELREQDLLIANVENKVITIDHECPNEIGFCILDVLETGTNSYMDSFTNEDAEASGICVLRNILELFPGEIKSAYANIEYDDGISVVEETVEYKNGELTSFWEEF